MSVKYYHCDSSGLALHAMTAIDWLEKLGYSEQHRQINSTYGADASVLLQMSTLSQHRQHACIATSFKYLQTVSLARPSSVAIIKRGGAGGAERKGENDGRSGQNDTVFV